MMTMDQTDVLKSAITRIDNELTVIQRLCFVFYNFLVYYFSWISIILSTRIKSERVFIENNNDDDYNVLGECDIYLHDSGIFINENFINYENIQRYWPDNHYIHIMVYASSTHGKITSSENILIVSIKVDDVFSFMETLKKNMYYHIKYNKLSTKVVKYYCKKNI